MARLESISKAVLEKLHDNDWISPSWLDKLKEEFSDVSAGKIDVIYSLRLKEKVDSLPRRLLQDILNEQKGMATDNKNDLLQKIIREKLGLNQE